MTVGDALLLYLDTFGYDTVKGYSQTEMKEGFLQLRQAFSVKKGLNPLKGLLNR